MGYVKVVQERMSAIFSVWINGISSRGGIMEKRKRVAARLKLGEGREGGGGTAHGWLLHTRQLPRIQQSGRMQDADTLWIMKPSASMPVWLLLANARSLLASWRRREIYEFVATLSACIPCVHREMRPPVSVCLPVCLSDRLSSLLASNFNCVKTAIHDARESYLVRAYHLWVSLWMNCSRYVHLLHGKTISLKSLYLHLYLQYIVAVFARLVAVKISYVCIICITFIIIIIYEI